MLTMTTDNKTKTAIMMKPPVIMTPTIETMTEIQHAPVLFITAIVSTQP